MKILPILIIILLIQGCASGPLSRANQIYRDYGGMVLKDQSDYDFGYFSDWETTKKPDNGSWNRNGKRLRRTNENDFHIVFGHFERRPDETVIEGTINNERGSELLESQKFLVDATEKTLEKLGFTIIGQELNTSLLAAITKTTRYKVYLVVNEEKGCSYETIKSCAVFVGINGARIGDGEIHYGGMTYGFSNSKHRRMGTQQGNIIAFVSEEQTTFDQREFYQALSEELPETIYLYLNASPNAHVRINEKEVVAYPYLMNKGKVIKFELPPEKS